MTIDYTFTIKQLEIILNNKDLNDEELEQVIIYMSLLEDSDISETKKYEVYELAKEIIKNTKDIPNKICISNRMRR